RIVQRTGGGRGGVGAISPSKPPPRARARAGDRNPPPPHHPPHLRARVLRRKEHRHEHVQPHAIVLGARGDCRWDNHERDLPPRRTDHGIEGGGSGGTVGGGGAPASEGGQFSLLVEAIATP